MNYFYTRILVVLIAYISGFINSIQSQCYTPPSYCNNISVTNGPAGYGIGIRNFTCGTINNTTTTPSSYPVYFDYTSTQMDTGFAGSVQNCSVVIGSGNRTIWTLYIDWNNDGVFNTTGTELAYAAPAFVNATATPQNFSFTVPAGQSAGVYRMRLASGNFVAGPPCGLLILMAR
jgi:hypothetical protein